MPEHAFGAPATIRNPAGEVDLWDPQCPDQLRFFHRVNRVTHQSVDICGSESRVGQRGEYRFGRELCLAATSSLRELRLTDADYRRRILQTVIHGRQPWARRPGQHGRDASVGKQP
jgi:hypothetical protein